MTSVAGAGTFALLSLAGTGDVAPDWYLGLACGLGGLIGGYLGARLQPRLRRGCGCCWAPSPPRWASSTPCRHWADLRLLAADRGWRAARAVRDNDRMRISARADYAVRAALQLASSGDDGPLKAEAIADAQDIPHKFLESILNDMRRAGSW